MNYSISETFDIWIVAVMLSKQATQCKMKNKLYIVKMQIYYFGEQEATVKSCFAYACCVTKTKQIFVNMSLCT